MALDPSIISGIRPVQIDSPVNALAQMLKVQSMSQEARLGQAKLEEYQRTKARQNEFTEWAKSLPTGTTDEQRITGMRDKGFYDEADKLETGIGNRRKVESEARSREWTVKKEQLDLAGQAFGFVRKNPTLEAAHQALDYLGANGIYTPDTVAQYKQSLAADPTKIASLADMAFRTVLDAKDQLSKVETRNLGGSTQTQGIDPVTAKTTVLSTAANSQSPDNRATVAASMANAAATREVAAATRDAARIQRDQGTEMKLADDYRTQSKGFKEVSDAYKQISAMLDLATTSPSATLAAAKKFMKLLDPGSVVRESELGMALAATGAIDRLTNYTNTLKYGKVLTANQAEDFRNITKQIYGAAQAQQLQIDGNYRRQAETYGLRPGVIIQDLGQNARGGKSNTAAAPAPKNAKGGTLMRDAQGNQAYVSPDGKQHEDVR